MDEGEEDVCIHKKEWIIEKAFDNKKWAIFCGKIEANDINNDIKIKNIHSLKGMERRRKDDEDTTERNNMMMKQWMTLILRWSNDIMTMTMTMEWHDNVKWSELVQYIVQCNALDLNWVKS